MALYLGIINNGSFVSSDGYSMQDLDGLSLYALSDSSKQKININGVVYRLNIKLPKKEGE